MQIIVDNKIPLANTLSIKDIKIDLINANLITTATVKNAGALIVRSITPVNANLVVGSKLKLIGSATAGTDHLDVPFLDAQQIKWVYAPGANASAVIDYVTCCFKSIQKKGLHTFKKAAVIGVGRVGQGVSNLLKQNSINVIEYDPPRALREPSFHSCNLADIDDCDLICIHTPLTHDIKHATHHMINHDFLSRLKPGTIILNAGRGAVMDTQAALNHPQLHYCLDVWENEPNINRSLLKQCLIATPHIASYQRQAKYLAAARVFNQAFEHLGINTQIDESLYQTPSPDQSVNNFNPIDYTQHFKRQLLESSQNFTQCRESYTWR